MIDGNQDMHVAPERPEAAPVAVEEGWQRRHPHVQLDRAAMRSLLGVAVLESEVLGGGLRNTNYKLRLATSRRWCCGCTLPAPCIQAPELLEAPTAPLPITLHQALCRPAGVANPGQLRAQAVSVLGLPHFGGHS